MMRQHLVWVRRRTTAARVDNGRCTPLEEGQRGVLLGLHGTEAAVRLGVGTELVTVRVAVADLTLNAVEPHLRE